MDILYVGIMYLLYSYKKNWLNKENYSKQVNKIIDFPMTLLKNFEVRIKK